MQFGRGQFRRSSGQYPFSQAQVFSTKRKRDIQIGMPQWSAKEWRGIFYSENCPLKDFLKQYAERLPCVEVSSTFYADVPSSTIQSWRRVVPETFKFLPKWPRVITHDHKLRHCTQDIHSFLSKMETLQSNLGTTLLQLPPQFSTEYRQALYNFLLQIPRDIPLNVEFRHASWFENRRLYAKLEDYFVKENIGMVCSDTPALPELAHLSFTGDQNVIRYLSDENLETDAIRLESWRQWLHDSEAGSAFYFILHRPNNERTPSLIPLISEPSMKKIDSLLQSPQASLF